MTTNAFDVWSGEVFPADERDDAHTRTIHKSSVAYYNIKGEYIGRKYPLFGGRFKTNTGNQVNSYWEL